MPSKERSSLKAWLFGILRNQARRRSARERRIRALLRARAATMNTTGRWSTRSRFQGAGWHTGPITGRAAAPLGGPAAPPGRTRGARGAPGGDRGTTRAPAEVVALRDVEGLGAEEVCELLEISEGNQRVLLHRGRSGVRDALEGYLDG